jgi:hypothetical protein
MLTSMVYDSTSITRTKQLSCIITNPIPTGTNKSRLKDTKGTQVAAALLYPNHTVIPGTKGMMVGL